LIDLRNDVKTRFIREAVDHPTHLSVADEGEL
jgi:hypothetical protein